MTSKRKVIRAIHSIGINLAIGFGITGFILLIYSREGSPVSKAGAGLCWIALGSLIIGILCGAVRKGIDEARED